MVKKQKEKLYQSSAERSQEFCRHVGDTARALPFECCALTLTPFEMPVMRVCKDFGIIFETSAILPYLMKYKKDPVTGEPMSSKDLYTLHIDKDEQNGTWQCPVLNKPFQKHTKIAAVIQRPENEAYVYSYEALQELCFKNKNYEDLITGKKFNRKEDVKILQDPQNDELNRLRDINHFAHTASLREKNKSASSNDVRLSITASRIVDTVKRKKEEDDENSKRKQQECDDTNTKKPRISILDLKGVAMTSGKGSGSFTSSSMGLVHDNSSREATAEEILQSQFDGLKKLKKKGFVRISTTLGVIDLEIHCDIVPKTASNFIGLVEKGAYDGSFFHRCIPNFMVQGGKPANSTEQETSIWGEAIRDEFDPRLTHSGGGIVSMANAGPHTNKRQFFITFKSAPHLDRKHSIFGRVVDGMNVLKSIESAATDDKDRPTEPIKIIRAEVLYSPIGEVVEKEMSRVQKRERQRQLEKDERLSATFGSIKKEEKVDNNLESASLNAKPIEISVGRYLKAVTEINGNGEERVNRLPPAPKKTVFSDFSGW